MCCFFFKQKTAYEMRISDWSSDVCSSDLDRALMLSAEEWGIVVLSLKVGGVAVLATLPIAFALAWVLARYRFPGRLLVDGLVHLPLVLPPVVTGWLLLIAFGPLGPAGRWLESWFGVSVMFRWPGAAPRSEE